MDLDNELDILLASKFRLLTMCSVSFILDQLPEDQSNKVRALIDAEIVPAPKIADVLSKNGFTIHSGSITRHRRRFRSSGCLCP